MEGVAVNKQGVTQEDAAASKAGTTGQTGGKKVSLKFLFAWPTRTIALSIVAMIFGYSTMFATDYLGLSAATIGVLFMVSKVVDAITDLVAGYIIDRTDTKLGKGRPYDLATLGMCATCVLMFVVPDVGKTGMYVWLFVMYTLYNAVFGTMTTCNEPVYLANALEDSDQKVSVISFSSIIGMLGLIAGGIAVPQIVKVMGTTRESWALIALIICIPCAAFGMIRFLLIPEVRKGAAQQESVTLRSSVKQLIGNKYILIIAVVIFLANLGSGLVGSANTYYYKYVMGDLGVQSYMTIANMSLVVLFVIMPTLSSRFGFTNIIRCTTIVGVVGYLIRLVAPTNLVLVFISTSMGQLGFLGVYSYTASFIIDCIDYGYWKTGVRSEGLTSCVQSFTGKVGTAASTGLLGILMEVAGYNGALATQSAAANNMIVALCSVAPAIFCLLMFVLLRFYDLDKYLPQIKEDLAAGRTQNAQ